MRKKIIVYSNTNVQEPTEYKLINLHRKNSAQYNNYSEKFHTFQYYCHVHLMNNLHTLALFLLILACSNKRNFLYILKRQNMTSVRAILAKHSA